MMKETVFSKMSPAAKMLLLLMLLFLGFIVSGLLTLIISAIYTKGDLNAASSIMSDLSNDKSIFLIKIIQLINHIGVFIFPVVVFALLVSHNFTRFLNINKGITIKNTIICFLIVASVLPLLTLLVNFNELMKLPEFMSGIEQWMRLSEEKAMLISETFLNVDSLGAYFFNLFLIALIPAIGEEFFFRGSMQKLMLDWFKNPHIAVFVASFIFSAIHLQFYGFIPRLFLGLILGYVYLWTQNLWYPILLHFINNAFTVTAYFIKNKYTYDVEVIEQSFSESVVIVVISTVILFVLLFVIKKSQKKPITEVQ